MSTPTPPPKTQTRADREEMLEKLPDGVMRVLVVTVQGKQRYKRPADVDVTTDNISLTLDGTPVVMRSKPGRRKRRRLKAVSPVVDEILQAKQEHLEHDLICKETLKGGDSDAVMNTVLHGLAKAAASMEFERTEAERNGLETSNISAKRARVLKSLADTLLKKRALQSNGVVDMESPAFRVLFAFVLETFKEAMREAGARSELVETAFAHLVKALDDGWKEDARRRMRDTLL